MRRLCGAALLALALAATASEARAHALSVTAVEARLDGSGGWRIQMTTDLDALMAGVKPGDMTPADYARLASAPAEQRAAATRRVHDFYRERVAILADGERLRQTVELPGLARPATWPPDAPIPLPGHVVELSGRFPAGSAAWQFAADPGFGPVLLLLFDDQGALGGQAWVPPGVLSEPLPIAVGAAGVWRTVLGYARLGFLHILPAGFDHVLFILGLFLLAPFWRPLLWQETAFTVAHTVTLGLAALGMIQVPAAVVEPLIALSIAFVAVENLLVRRLTPLRTVVVFLFGLLHGLGFAGVLGELGLPPTAFTPALAGFALGVELGQVAVLALAFAAVGWARCKPWFRRRITIPGSLAIAALGLWWTVERLLGG
jgi:hypothetical protein